MEIHHIHGTEIGFHGGTEHVKELFQHKDAKHEVERHLGELAKHGETHIYVDGQKYKMTQTEHGGKTIASIERSHSL